MSDALSKTVPIWCAVINRCLSPGKRWDKAYFPEECVSAQEISSIESLIPSFVTTFKNSGVDIPSLATLLNKPLRPIFITPESNLDLTISNEYYPVILVTASSLVPCGHKRIEGFVYIQGAADDEESWACELTSLLFWDHYEMLLECTEENELVNMIEEIVGNGIQKEMKEDETTIGSTGISLGIGTASTGHATIICGSEANSMGEEMVLHLHIPRKSKPLTVMTQTLFPTVISFAVKHGILNNSPISIIATDSSRQVLDISIATTLIILCLFFDDKGISSR